MLQPQAHAVVLGPEVFVLAAVAYGVLYFSMGAVWLPGAAPFAALLIWAGALLGAELARWLRVPRVVGMLAAGLILANAPGSPAAALPDKWGVQMRAAALATIFLRCGLELEFGTMNLYKWPALRLALVPGVIEAFFDAGLGVALFGMPFALALSMGFILKAVGPGLVVPAMLALQKEGWGADKGVPSTIVIAASFDDIIAITGFSVAINVAIAGGADAAWQIASGPLQVVFGILGGVLAGVLLGCTRVLNNKYKRLAGIYGAALLLMFFLEAYDMLSGGALGALFTGLVACFMWERGLPRAASLGPSDGFSPDVERVMAMVWNWVMEPLLFGTIGASIVFADLVPSTIPKSVAIILAGVALRVGVTFAAMADRAYTWRERAFFAAAWTPKATVQASLSAVPLSMAAALPSGRPDHASWVIWGQEILTTGVFAIIICGTAGTALVFALAPKLLERGEQQPSEHAPPPPPPGAAQPPAPARSAGGGLGFGGGGEGYFDAIERLAALVRAHAASLPPDAAGAAVALADSVAVLQERIDREVALREMTVRQMLHHAALRSRDAPPAAAPRPPPPPAPHARPPVWRALSGVGGGWRAAAGGSGGTQGGAAGPGAWSEAAGAGPPPDAVVPVQRGSDSTISSGADGGGGAGNETDAGGGRRRGSGRDQESG
ncbi:MAG: Sodium/hydrogen exchanger family-domain-containing protein [Monoraphidium minutum]|nr:MAG: Sodium/hydrogen exchanger family-domain-containing protein [Monoraphidium minutum]